MTLNIALDVPLKRQQFPGKPGPNESLPVYLPDGIIEPNRPDFYDSCGIAFLGFGYF